MALRLLTTCSHINFSAENGNDDKRRMLQENNILSWSKWKNVLWQKSLLYATSKNHIDTWLDISQNPSWMNFEVGIKCGGKRKSTFSSKLPWDPPTTAFYLHDSCALNASLSKQFHIYYLTGFKVKEEGKHWQSNSKLFWGRFCKYARWQFSS